MIIYICIDLVRVAGIVREYLSIGALLHQQCKQTLRRRLQVPNDRSDQNIQDLLEQGGYPSSGEHQEGGAHQHQLQRPDVGNLQPADSPR